MTPEELRSEILRGRADIPALAAALNCSTRAIYALAERLRIPYVKIRNRRFFEIAAIRAALEAEHRPDQREPRRPGRPARGGRHV